MADIQFKEVPVLTYEDLSAQAKMVLSLGTSYPVATRLLGQVALDSVRQWLELNFGIIDYIGKYASLSSAITAIGTEQRKTLLINEPIEITSTTTVPDNITLWILDGCVITANAELTMRIPICGSYQIFDGTGLVRLTGPGTELLPQWWGAVADGITDCTTAIQSALDNSFYLGGVPVLLGVGTYIISNTLWIYSGTILCGSGTDSTIIELANNSDCTMIKSGGDPALRNSVDPTDFDNLTTTDTWDVIPYGFGLQNLGLSGNRANQSAGSGVQFYGKRLYCNNVIIHDIYDTGWYSEAGSESGQSSYHHMPESIIGPLWIRRCNNVGFHFKGPHDATITSLFVAGGINGVIINSDETSNASIDIGHIHQYNASDIGVQLSKGCRIDTLIAENNGYHGVYITAWGCQISKILTYKNCKTTTGAYVYISGGNNIINQIVAKDISDEYLIESYATGVEVVGRWNQISNILVNGTATTPYTSKCVVGVSIDNDNIGGNILEGVIQNCLEGTGLKIGTINAQENSKFNFVISNCAVLLDNVRAGSKNIYNIVLNGGGATTTLFTGVGPNIDNSELWNITGDTNTGVIVYSHRRRLSGSDVDMTSTSVVSRSIAHGLISTPNPEDVQLTFYGADIGSAFRWDIFPFVTGVDATYVYVMYKLGTIGTNTGKLIVWVNV